MPRRCRAAASAMPPIPAPAMITRPGSIVPRSSRAPTKSTALGCWGPGGRWPPRRDASYRETGVSREDRHDHDHADAGPPLSDVRLRVKALESLLVDKGLGDPPALSRRVSPDKRR